jgi:hypothetical protein
MIRSTPVAKPVPKQTQQRHAVAAAIELVVAAAGCTTASIRTRHAFTSLLIQEEVVSARTRSATMDMQIQQHSTPTIRRLPLEALVHAHMSRQRLEVVLH